MLLALGLFQQTRRRKGSGGFQVPCSLTLCFWLWFFRFRLSLGFGFRRGLGLRLRRSLGFEFRLGFGPRFRLGLGFRFSLGPGLRRGLGFRFVLLFQKFIDALFHRRQIIRDAPSHLMPIRGELNAADQVRRGLEPDANIGREGLVERILYGRALLRRHVKRAAHNRGVGG